MLPATPDPIIMVSTEEGSAAVVRCACRKLFGGVCQKECVEEGLGSPGSVARTSSIIGNGGDAASAMMLLVMVTLVVGDAAKSSGGVGWAGMDWSGEAG